MSSDCEKSLVPQCDNCRVFMLLERKRAEWYKKLSMTNIGLNEQIAKQQVIIDILKEKLSLKRRNLLLECIQERFQKTDIHEMDEYIALFNSEFDSLKERLAESEDKYSENLARLTKSTNFFRQHLFLELETSNYLKQYLLDKLREERNKMDRIICNKIKDEKQKVGQEFRSRYQNTIQRSREEIERRDVLLSKIRQHNKQLYAKINQLKRENDEELADLKKEIKDLKFKLSRK